MKQQIKISKLKDLNNLIWDDNQFFSGFGKRGLESCSFHFYEFERSTSVEGEITYYMCLASSKQKFLESSFRRGGGCLGFHISLLSEKYFISLSSYKFEHLSLKDAALLLSQNKKQG